jgi:hypothetical protein
MAKFKIEFRIRRDTESRYNAVYTALNRFVSEVSSTEWTAPTSTLYIETDLKAKQLRHAIASLVDPRKDYVNITPWNHRPKTYTIGTIPQPELMDQFYERVPPFPEISAGPPRVQPESPAGALSALFAQAPNVLAPRLSGALGINALSQNYKP